MNNIIASIEKIHSGTFFVKIDNVIKELQNNDELPLGAEILGHRNNTLDNSVDIFIPSMNKTISLSGNNSLLLDDGYFELLAMMSDDNSNLIDENKDAVVSNEEYQKQLENLEETAAGDTTKEELPALQALSYSSEYQISDNYETINLQNLDTYTTFSSDITSSLDTTSSLTGTNQPPIIYEDIALSIEKFSLTEESITLDTVIAKFDITNIQNLAQPITYAINSDYEDFFIINQTTGEITLTQNGIDAINSDNGIDMDSIDFSLVISNPTDSITQNISIDVQRINDNPPTLSAETSPLVEESLSTNTIIGKVNVSDLDDGDSNTPYTYSLDPTNTNFRVDESGNIYLTQAGIDAINSDVGIDITNLNFDVYVNDGSNVYSQNLSFDITRVNDNALDFTPTPSTTVSENSVSVGTIVATIDITDLDDSTYEYSLEGTHANYLTIEDGVVKLNSDGVNAINSDIGVDLTQLSFSVKVTDTEYNETITKAVTVDVARVDENAPTITINSQVTTLEEQNNLSTTTIVATISATDIDDSSNITYSIKPSSTSDYFSVDTNGVITLSQNGVDTINSDVGVDLTSLSFIVVASDGTNASEQNISFDITRVNDNAPTISISTQNTLTEESISTATIVAQLTASDLDDLDTNNLNFSLSLTSANRDYFVVSSTGLVTLTQAGIDRINNDSLSELTTLNLTVEVTDGVFSTTKDLTIDITRVYDTPPVIDVSSFAQIAIDGAVAGDTVSKIFFGDLDDNDDVTYTITAGNNNGFFEIDNTNDSIVLTEAGATYINTHGESILANLTIQASDKSDNLSNTQTIQIKTISNLTFPPNSENSDGFLEGTDSNENFEYDATPIDGKGGYDTFFLQDDVNINLTGLAKNIEKIDLSVNGTHTVSNVSLQDVIDATDASNDLIIYGGLDDSVSLTNEWQSDGQIVENGVTYNQYSDVRESGDPTVVLKISQDVDTQIG